MKICQIALRQRFTGPTGLKGTGSGVVSEVDMGERMDAEGSASS